MDFKASGNNLFFFQFGNRLDLLKVKYSGPLHFDQNILVLEHFNGNLTPEKYQFNTIHVWLHVIDLPLKCMTLACAKQFDNLAIWLENVEWDKGVSKIVWGRKMCIRVEIPIDQPLMIYHTRSTQYIMLRSCGSYTHEKSGKSCEGFVLSFRKVIFGYFVAGRTCPFGFLFALVSHSQVYIYIRHVGSKAWRREKSFWFFLRLYISPSRLPIP